MSRRSRWATIFVGLVCFSCGVEALRHGGIPVFGQSPPVDPGPRGGAAAAGGPLPGLSGTEITFFNAALAAFQLVFSVDGSLAGQSTRGLGPRFNMPGCEGCHVFPTTGGSSPASNPQPGFATNVGGTNTVPPFVTVGGPIVEVRFKSDGLIHQIYVITHRSDAPAYPSCNLAQPTFAPGTFSLRATSPIFGDGLVENTPDETLIAAQNSSLMTALGITRGTFNRAADGTIARFGWKAQTKSLLAFSGEAANVEMGVTNEFFPNELANGGCATNVLPEDKTPPAGGLSNVENFANFMRLLAPPTPIADNSSIINGRAKFQTVGCHACHVMSQTTATSPYTGQSNVTYAPFSDFALHAMGTTLDDGITQGAAGTSQFRTAPLWGIGQRIFFLHDGRTSDIYQAIQQHSSTGSEANTVIVNFNTLSVPDQQDILNFLRAL
jgi:CxxC motif-containing protein (DUF1111 family)